MSYCDLEPASVWAVAEPVARKQHKCCECTAPILPGEKYVRVKMVYDGTAETFKQHTACAEACEAERDRTECLPMGGFKEFWHDDGQFLDKKDPEVAKVRKLWAKVLRRERTAEKPKEGA